MDIVSQFLGPVRVNFDAETGFNLTDTNDQLLVDVPADLQFNDVINNRSGALIDGDIIAGFGDDVLTNEGEIIGDINLGRGEDVFNGAGSNSGNSVNG